jgi:hypothetical protein
LTENASTDWANVTEICFTHCYSLLHRLRKTGTTDNTSKALTTAERTLNLTLAGNTKTGFHDKKFLQEAHSTTVTRVQLIEMHLDLRSIPFQPFRQGGGRYEVFTEQYSVFKFMKRSKNTDKDSISVLNNTFNLICQRMRFEYREELCH